MSRSALSTAAITIGLALVTAFGACSTAPKAEKQPELSRAARSSTAWFERNVSGLSSQIEHSAGYVIFPDVVQYGILIGGGTMGRGVLCEPDGDQTGWAAINSASAGLQAGVQGLKMLMVIQDQATLMKFKANQLTGSVSGVLVAVESGGSSAAPFQDGVAIYQGANKGLMAGVRVALDYIRYEPMKSSEAPLDTR